MSAAVSVESVDYLQRTLQPVVDLAGPWTRAVPSSRRLVRVRGIGRPPRAEAQLPPPKEVWRPPTTNLLTGLYGYRIPLVFSLVGRPDGIEIRLGTWSTRESAHQDRRHDVLTSVLRSLHPIVELAAADPVSPDLPLGGLALGHPAPDGLDMHDRSAAVDRLLRSLAGDTFEAFVLAYPVAESALGTIRAQVLNESRAVANAVRAEGATSPLAEQYTRLLEVSHVALGEALATGGWRTCVYLRGDRVSYPRLATAWRAAYSTQRSVPEPVRIVDRSEVARLADEWAMPDTPAPGGPGLYRRPFELQTLLTTAQLAAYVHLPELETPGFRVSNVPRFDSVAGNATSEAREAVRLGTVQHQRRDTATPYQVSLRQLTRHAFIAGTTGSGKTNTIFSLLSEVDAAGVPFLVVEPAKAEYRALLEHPTLGPRLRVWTAGRATVGPLLLNPLEVPGGTEVSEHLDLVRAAFGAAFGLWTPLPQILERCLHEVYADRGWDLRTNQNARLAEGDDPQDAFPTLSDLVAKVGEVVPTLGYDEKVTGDMQAALLTRLESLCSGGKGAMLDVTRSLPVEELFGHPSVIELEALGDEGDKAFLVGLLLIRLAEHRRAQGAADRLVHLLVVEEAHRLLANVGRSGGAEEADPRGQAVETFSNLLSEIRAYGQGVVIADQVPVRLAPDVVKNTNLKVAHRLVSADDREVMAGAMAMEEGQSRALTTLAPGEAAVFSAGDDSPLLVQLPRAKDAPGSAPPSHARVAEHMARWRTDPGRAALYLARPFCALTCAGAPDACDAARRLVADDYVQRTLGRIVLSTIEDAGALDRLWVDLVDVLRARRPGAVPEDALLRSFAGHGADWYASRRGAQNQWSYVDTALLRDRLLTVLLAKADPSQDGDPAGARAELQEVARRLHRRTFLPYQACEFTCRQDPPLCLYRSAVADLVASRRYQPSWREADATDATSADNSRTQTWEICQDAAFELIEFPEPDGDPELNDGIVAAAKRVCLCFEQQMLADDHRKVPRTSRRILARVLGEAQL